MKRVALFLVALFAAVAIVSCSRQSTSGELVTTGSALNRDVVIARASVATAGSSAQFEMSSLTYAEVNSKWMAAFMDRYRTDLHNKGVDVSLVSGSSGWNAHFNCTMFSELYVADAGAELLNALSTHASVTWPQFSRPAIFEIWYIPDSSPVDPKTGVRLGHAIVLLITETGPRFVDPQSQATPTGEVRLSDTEKASIYHRQA